MSDEGAPAKKNSFNCRSYFQCPMAPDNIFEEKRTGGKT